MNRLLLFISVFVSISAFTGCMQQNQLEKAYKNIYLSKYSIDFPATNEALNICLEKNITRCIELYQKSKDGKELLLSYDSVSTLEFTLNTIEKHCLLDALESDKLCKGAIMSLYFFNSEKQDEKILTKFTSYDFSLTTRVLGYSEYAWYSNRSKKSEWVAHIDRQPDDVFKQTDKQRVIYYFKSSSDESVKSGITLL